MKTTLYNVPETLKDAAVEDLRTASEAERDMLLKRSADVEIRVNGERCDLYETNVNHSRKWEKDFLPPLSRTPVTYFDFEGKADITVAVPEQKLDKVTVHPLSYGIIPRVDKETQTVSFSVEKPDTYTVMFQDAPERAIHIFANPLEEEVPDVQEENVLYFGPGEWDAGTISVMSGQTIYIAGGAVVHGAVSADGVENVTVMGRGILDGSKYEGWRAQQEKAKVPLRFDHCKNVVIKDILILNTNAWVCQGYDTENMEIDNLKVVSCRPNSDGITLQSCKNVEVKNCFIRSWDDSLVIKNYAGNSEHIHFSNIQLWTDFAQSMEIGYETNKGCRENSSISDITFTDICVLHNYHKPVISIHNADEATVEGVEFRNIVVEDASMGNGDGAGMPYLIDFVISGDLGWATTKRRGMIKNISIENIKVLSGTFCGSRICGFDETHKVSNVTITDLEILGKKITDPETGKFKIDETTTENIKFK